MKAKDIKEKGEYSALVSGRVVSVRVEKITMVWEPTRHTGQMTQRRQYEVTNIDTGRPLALRSASRFLGPTAPPPDSVASVLRDQTCC